MQNTKNKVRYIRIPTPTVNKEGDIVEYSMLHGDFLCSFISYDSEPLESLIHLEYFR